MRIARTCWIDRQRGTGRGVALNVITGPSLRVTDDIEVPPCSAVYPEVGVRSILVRIDASARPTIGIHRHPATSKAKLHLKMQMRTKIRSTTDQSDRIATLYRTCH